MALIGYGRVSTDTKNTERQRDALDNAGCIRIFEEKITGKTGHKDRPALAAALDYMREDDMLCGQEVDRWAGISSTASSCCPICSSVALR